MMQTNQPKNEILELSLEFALEIIKIFNTLPRNLSNIILIKQGIRSGTSIGANVEEAVGANSKKEFIHCMTIARKEARETRYWLRLLLMSNNSNREELIKLGEKITSILKLLNQIVKTSRENIA